MNEKQVKMEFKKATKNTFVYAAKEETAAVVQSVYLERSVIGATPPTQVIVTVSWPK